MSPDVSIVVATCDRPDDLRRCLQSLAELPPSRPLEVIVVDNRPDSGISAPVVAEFPGVVRLVEPRPGVAYARNAGILAARGAIIVTIDDDVIAAPEWLEHLLAPFARPEVMAVTGDVLPVALDTAAERLFEAYGGLGRGSERFEMTGDDFRRARLPVPVWKLGGTANAAFRVAVFADPAIGLMEETLGPGMPSGVGEDIYLFFEILRAGHTIVYEPAARVRHRHRRALADVRRQIYGYSKGFVSFQLTTLWRDHDWRAVIALLAFLPVHRVRQLIAFVAERRSDRLRLMLTEIAGNLAGPWALWRSCRRVRRLGRSASGTRLPAVPVDESAALPSITVAVCTRDRPDLAACLESLARLDYPELDLLVVDNAPSTDAAERLVRAHPRVRYVCEPRPGLSWARNRAIAEARGDVIAFTDDDVMVEPGWLKALAAELVARPDVMAVTGQVVPFEITTAAQELFESQGGLRRGTLRREFRAPRGGGMPWQLVGTGQCGTGANMAFRRAVFAEIGGFDPALGAGAPTGGSEDQEMFFRVLKAGHTLVYAPAAVVRHRHRRDYAALRAQLASTGSVFAYFLAAARAHPEDRPAFARAAASWLWRGHLQPLATSFLRPSAYPRDLLWAQLAGAARSVLRYPRARRLARARAVYDRASELPAPAVAPDPPLDASTTVSIVIATYDRPDLLRQCLASLRALATPRAVEIVVVDNHPASALTPPVVAEFPDVMLVEEPRQGLSYARNAGIAASHGDVVVTTDDDILVPPTWLETLLAPLSRAEVMVVTGNVLPYAAATDAEKLFEEYGSGGFQRGTRRFEWNGETFCTLDYAIPTWDLGGTGNAAFRASLFAPSALGGFDETLGAGTPAGSAEDIYFFYRVLAADHTIVYEPAAFVWHQHRRDLTALRRQLFSYSKGCVAYHLSTWLRAGDWRAFRTLAYHLPVYQVKQLWACLVEGRPYPTALVWLEILGNALGPWALWRSRRRVRRLGPARAYVPPALRPRAEPAPDVSIVVATCDRPDDLRRCLRSLAALATTRRCEVIVADNHPASGLTPPVVAEFPSVVLVAEPRRGVSYARNAAIGASRGALVVVTDDDMVFTPECLDALLAPFARADVAAVTGRVLPVALTTSAERIFAAQLGERSEGFEVRGDTTRGTRFALPVWELGGTGNVAFRASVFQHPDIGLMEEALGPGMPCGGAEDKYFLYRILRAGLTVVYEPAALGFHRHRETMPALRRQIYAYAKSVVGYHLLLLRDRDWRALPMLAFYLPRYQLQQLRRSLRGGAGYPLSLVLLEIGGYLAGPWSCMRSFLRVRRLGRSAPYVPVERRRPLSC